MNQVTITATACPMCAKYNKGIVSLVRRTNLKTIFKGNSFRFFFSFIKNKFIMNERNDIKTYRERLRLELMNQLDQF